jgi:hypothetical protein
MSTLSPTQKAVRRYQQRQRRQLKAIGQWQDPQVDAAPVREHILAIRATGMSIPVLTKRIGLPPTALKNVMWGANGRPPGKTVARDTAEAVLSYWPVLEDFPDSALIDPTGTVRRCRALQVRGFSMRWQAGELGLMQQNYVAALASATVSARLARRVAALYDRMWNQQPEDHGVAPTAADWVRQYAAKRGYSGPLAWDDDTIDNPNAVPVTDAEEPVVSEGGNLAARYLAGEAVILDNQARKEVLAHRFEWSNLTTAEIAEELGMTAEAAEQAWSRMKRKAKAEGRRLWRRVYVARLNQNDMEEAA